MTERAWNLQYRRVAHEVPTIENRLGKKDFLTPILIWILNSLYMYVASSYCWRVKSEEIAEFAFIMTEY